LASKALLFKLTQYIQSKLG